MGICGQGSTFFWDVGPPATAIMNGKVRKYGFFLYADHENGPVAGAVAARYKRGHVRLLSLFRPRAGDTPAECRAGIFFFAAAAGVLL